LRFGRGHIVDLFRDSDPVYYGDPKYDDDPEYYPSNGMALLFKHLQSG
jgi:hypothetical protein